MPVARLCDAKLCNLADLVPRLAAEDVRCLVAQLDGLHLPPPVAGVVDLDRLRDAAALLWLEGAARLRLEREFVTLSRCQFYTKLVSIAGGLTLVTAS